MKKIVSFQKANSKFVAVTLLIACVFVLCSCSSANNKKEQVSHEQFFIVSTMERQL